jgi:hypothetical protein
MIIIPDDLLGSLVTTMFVRYNHNPFILNKQTLRFTESSLAPINKLQLFLLYFFLIVKERN